MIEAESLLLTYVGSMIIVDERPVLQLWMQRHTAIEQYWALKRLAAVAYLEKEWESNQASR